MHKKILTSNGHSYKVGKPADRTQFEFLLGNLTEKPQGKPTLVPYSDKRSEWSNAQEDFNE